MWHNIAKISLKRVEMDFWLGSKNSIIGKTPRKPQDMTELSTNYVTFTKIHRDVTIVGCKYSTSQDIS
jgi:hypothetical protein